MQKTPFHLLVLGAVSLLATMAVAQTSGTTAAKTPHKPASTATKSSTASKPSSTASKHVTALTTDKQKTSYAIGMSMAKSLQRQSVDVDEDVLIQGLKDTLANGKTLLTDDQAQATLTTLQTQMRAKMEAKLQEMSTKNKQEGEAFLAANKSKEGVVTLPSGLQYKVLKSGTGPKPTATDSVVCNYRGTLIDGKEFDSSYKRGQPATFPVNRVIKGWTEALQLMPVGSKWQLFVPADLAYGERGAGPDIGPNSTLIFEVELVSIEQAKKE